MSERIVIDTTRGPAYVDLDAPAHLPALSLLVLGHGAGGGVDAPDLVAVRDAASDHGVIVARVTQPYRVAGRRAPAPAAHLDEAWRAVVGELRRRYPAPALVVGGRSSGARVACRTAVALKADGVVALAFPLRPPRQPDRSRLSELPVGIPTLVVTGDRDPFGVPPAGPQREVAVLPGEGHALNRHPSEVAQVVMKWLRVNGWAR